ncbi:MAG: glycosyltransferase family 4 protein [Bernardetiaceae bacterium]
MATHDRRPSVGLIFSYAEAWIGGSYYLLNLIKALGALPDPECPRLILYAEDPADFEIAQRETAYPYLQFEQATRPLSWRHPLRLLNKISYRFNQKLLLPEHNPHKASEVCFPNPKGYFYEVLSPRYPIFWIPDFQEVHLPHFFSEEEIKFRYATHQRIATQEKFVIFSSRDAQKDFQTLFPTSTVRSFVLNFAVSHPPYAHLDGAALRAKHGLEPGYFFAPNQFWQHKNQRVILEALAALKARGEGRIQVAFSGKMEDRRKPDYVPGLLAYVREQGLEEWVRFLGFLDRGEQLKLMSEARAVVQPSLFEGWSTVVEDAKAMNQHLILSNLAVHREQRPANATFFDPKNASSLADLLLQQATNPPKKQIVDYSLDVLAFGRNFLSILQAIGGGSTISSQ